MCVYPTLGISREATRLLLSGLGVRVVLLWLAFFGDKKFGGDALTSLMTRVRRSQIFFILWAFCG